MAKPDVMNHMPNPHYLRTLIEVSGLSQQEAARRIGIDPRTMRGYLSLKKRSRNTMPYVVQFALEGLASVVRL
jgi:hypothetical protein